MRRFNTLLLFSLFILTFSCVAAPATQSIRFACEATYPPFEFVNAAGQLDGFDIALGKALCKQLKATCTFVNQPWDSLIPGLTFKKFDAVISAMGITSERKKHAAFSVPYYQPSGSFVAHQDNLFALTEAGLQGKVIAYQIGTTFGDYLKAHYGNTIRVKTYASESGAILDLLAGRVDALFGDTPVLQHWLQQATPSPYKLLGHPIKSNRYFGEGYGIALHPDNKELQKKLNQALSELKAKGIYDQLVTHYFGTHSKSGSSLRWQYLPLLLSGLKTTLGLALSSLVLGLFFGILSASVSKLRSSWLRGINAGFVHLIRGLPEILVLFLVYYGSTFLFIDVFHFKASLSPFFAGTLALSLLFGAYASHVLRGAFAAIPKGQHEAAFVLGLTQRQTFFRILLPQAWRYALPGLGNLWFVLLKDTALVSLIGTHDLMIQAQVASANTLEPFTFYGLATLTYLLLTSLSEAFLVQLRQRATRHLSLTSKANS